MKKIFSKSKLRGKSPSPVPESGAAAKDAESVVGYVIKEKDLSKVHKAAWLGDLTKLRQLTSKKGEYNVLDKENRTPLHLAAAQGHTDVVEYLVTSKAKLNLCDNEQRSPLLKAVQCNHIQCVHLLVKYKADPNLIDADGNTALHLAAGMGSVDCVQLLLQYGALPNAANKEGSMPIHFATLSKQTEILELLIQANADVNGTDNANRTALMLACQIDQMAIVKVLLENKANMNIKDEKGWTASDHASMGGFHGCSHLIDEYQSKSRPSSAMRQSGLFGSTAGSTDAFGLNFGGPAEPVFDDDDEDVSLGKKSFDDDSWGNSASEVEEIPKVKPKVTKPLKLSKFLKDSDNSDLDDATPRSSVSKSKIPRHSSKSSITSIESERSLKDQRVDASKSKIPTKAAAAPVNSAQGPRGKQLPVIGNRYGPQSSEPNSFDSVTPSSTPREKRTNVIGQRPRAESATSIGSKPTCRQSVGSMSETISDWDDDEDILGDLSDGAHQKPSLLPKDNRLNGPKEPASQGASSKTTADQDKQTRKDVLSKLGMSDIEEDEDSSPMVSEASQVDQRDTIKRQEQHEQPANTEKAQVAKTVNDVTIENGIDNAGNDDDGDSNWDSEDDDMMPSEASNNQVAPAIIKPGTYTMDSTSEGEDIEEAVKPKAQVPIQARQVPLQASQVPKDAEGPPQQKPSKGNPGGGNEMRAEDEDEVDFDSEEEEEEEESEWEKDRKSSQVANASRAEQKQQKEFLERQRKWEEEQKVKQEHLRREAEEEIRREREELQREAELERKRIEEERLLEEQKRKEAEKKLEEERRREKERLEEEKKEWQRREEERIEMERGRLEKEAEMQRQKLEEERRHLEEERQKEEEIRLMEKERAALEGQKLAEFQKQKMEESRRLKEEKKMLEKARLKNKKLIEEEQRKLEEKRQKEEVEIAEERKRIEEDKMLERKRLEEEEKKRKEEWLKEERHLEDLKREQEKEKEKREQELQKIEVEQKRLVALKEEQEDERKRLEMERKEEQKRLEEERKKTEELKVKLEEEVKRKRSVEVQEDQVKDSVKKKLEADKKHLEEEGREIERRKREFEEREKKEKLDQDQKKSQLQDEELRLKDAWEELERKRKETEEIARKEMKQREEEQRKWEEHFQREVEERREASQAFLKEEGRMKKEKQQLLEETQEIERKKNEFEEMRRQLEQGDAQRMLLKYQEKIENKLVGEENGIGTPSVDGDYDDIVDELSNALEEVVLHRKEKGIEASPGHNPMPASHMVNGTGGKEKNPQRNPSNEPAVNHLNGNISCNNPPWQAVLEEPDGLDISNSSDGGDVDQASDAEGTGTFAQTLGYSPIKASTPLPASGTLPPSPSYSAMQDVSSMTKMQILLRDMKFKVHQEKQAASFTDSRCQRVQEEMAALTRKLEEFSDAKKSLEECNLGLENRISTLEHELVQEIEKRCNAELLLKKTREQLLRKETLFTQEQENKQQAELSARSVHFDLRVAQNIIRQLEEERDEVRKQLNQERNSRKMQDTMVREQMLNQETLQEETSKFVAEKTEAVNRLEAADISRKQALDVNDKLKTDLFTLKMELERQMMRARDKEGMLATQNEDLENKIEELRGDLGVNAEALEHANLAYSTQLSAVRTENGKLRQGVEKFKNKSDNLQTELRSLQKQLTAANQEMERIKQLKEDSERNFFREKDDLKKSIEKKDQELVMLKESSKMNAKQLGSLEVKVNNLQTELQVSSATLGDRTSQLHALHQERDNRNASHQSQDFIFQKEREEKARLSAKVESLTERLNAAKMELMSVQKALENAQQQNTMKERETVDVHEKFNSTLNALQVETDRARNMWEEKHANMVENMSRLREDLMRSEHARELREQEIKQMQQELMETQSKLSVAETSHEMMKKTEKDQEKEKKNVSQDIRNLQEQITILEMAKKELGSKLDRVQSELSEAERNSLNASQQLMITQTSLKKQDDLIDRLREVETERAKLEVVLQQERERSEGLKTELQQSQQIKASLETLVTNLKSANMHIGDRLSEETATRSLMAKDAEDHRDLWETEIKSRSKLGLKLTQLERSRLDIQGQVEAERRKTRRLNELKKQVEEKLQNEISKNHQLEETAASLKAKLKLARRKLKDLEVPEAKINILQTEFDREKFNLEAVTSTLRRQLEDVSQQLERENLARANLERINRQLQLDLNGAKTVQKGKDKLERTKRKLEEELSFTKNTIQQSYIEKGELEKYKQELDAKARIEINEKLEQVNNYLEEQSLAQERLEKMRLNNEAGMKKELENTISDLKSELSEIKSSSNSVLTEKDSMEAEVRRYMELYKQEVDRKEKVLSELQLAQERQTELQTKLNLEKHKTKHHRTRSVDLISPQGSPQLQFKHSKQTASVDPITEKVWEELNKSIARHLDAPSAERDGAMHEFASSHRSSASAAALSQDPTSNYISVLKRNYFV